MPRFFTIFLFCILLSSNIHIVFADDPPPIRPVDFTSDLSVTFTFTCPYPDNKTVQITLTPRIPTSTYFDPHDFQGYEDVTPFANPSIAVDLWLTHSGWSENSENPSDLIRQCVQGGNDRSDWSLAAESDMWAYIDVMMSQPFTITQGEHTTVMGIKAATVIGNQHMTRYSEDIRNIPGLLAEIDPRFELLLNFNPEPQPVTDYFLITCLWGPYGTSWGEYSRVDEYYSYSRLVLWLTPHQEILETPIP